MNLNVGVTPQSQGFRLPAEWEKHSACWLAWPTHQELWLDYLSPVQAEFTALCQAIGESEKLNILVPSRSVKAQASKALKNLDVTFYEIPFGDIWLRDTAPIFVKSNRAIAALPFKFNSWGGKYDLPYDPDVPEKISKASGLKAFSQNWVLEGGSLEVDGEGTCLTSKQCLLNENRNPTMKVSDFEIALFDAFGVTKVLWLTEGLINDHTDGHVDTIARFSAPGEVICMTAESTDDPNKEILEKIKLELGEMTDSKGRKLKIHEVPSPGLICDDLGSPMPASYVNFYISNTKVIVPTYGSPFDEKAVKVIGECFPGRNTIGLSAKFILSGGGAFHCITQQVPQ